MRKAFPIFEDTLFQIEKPGFEKVCMFQLEANSNLELHNLHVKLISYGVLDDCLMNEFPIHIDYSELKGLLFVVNIHDVLLAYPIQLG